MILQNRISTVRGTFDVEYHDTDDFNSLPLELCTQAYGICYVGDMIVLCCNTRGGYVLPGGTVEPGESLEQTLIREVQEESNMHVLAQLPIGYQKVIKVDEPDKINYQVRYVALVEPYGQFTSDPAGHIASIELANEQEAPKLLNWGVIGDRLFERAREKRLLVVQ